VAFVLVTAPASEPVTLAEAKTQLNLEIPDDDTFVSELIKTARQYVEEVLSRALFTQTWGLYLDAFPPSCGYGVSLGYCPPAPRPGVDPRAIALPRGQLTVLAMAAPAVSSVKYIDSAGTLQTLVADTDYIVDTVSVPPRVIPAYGKNWPAARCQWNAVQVVYAVGWVDTASIPAPLKQAILLLVSQMYEHRTPEVIGTIISKVQFTFDALLAPYRIHHF